MRNLINAQQFDEHHENADAEIQVSRSFSAHRRGQRQAALAEHEDQRTFSFEDEIGDTPVARGDRQAKKKSRKFKWHIEMVCLA